MLCAVLVMRPQLVTAPVMKVRQMGEGGLTGHECEAGGGRGPPQGMSVRQVGVGGLTGHEGEAGGGRGMKVDPMGIGRWV